MTKVVLKKSEVLKSARPVVIQPLEEKIQAIPLENITSPSSPASSQSTLDLLMNLDKDDHDNHEETPATTEATESVTEEKPAENQEEITQQAQQILEQAQNESRRILSAANEEKEQILAQANKQAEEIRSTIEEQVKEARESATKKAQEEGYQKAESENKRLIQLLQKITVDMVDEKTKILDTIESDIVDLILMISSKVVKSITAQYKQVVFDNVVAAIKKLKVHNNLVIKVNPEDLYTVEQYKTNILNEINGIENIQFLEDPSVEIGGCIIQSDFGSVDGRISSQLAEIEEQIRKISPIKPL